MSTSFNLAHTVTDFFFFFFFVIFINIMLAKFNFSHFIKLRKIKTLVGLQFKAERNNEDIKKRRKKEENELLHLYFSFLFLTKNIRVFIFKPTFLLIHPIF